VQPANHSPPVTSQHVTSSTSSEQNVFAASTGGVDYTT